MNYICDIDGGFSIIENLKVSGAREGIWCYNYFST